MFDAMRKKIARRARNQVAPYRCIDAVEAAATLPLEKGLAREREFFDEVRQGEETNALKYVFWAEREAAKVPDVPRDTPAKKIASAAVHGARPRNHAPRNRPIARSRKKIVSAYTGSHAIDPVYSSSSVGIHT